MYTSFTFEESVQIWIFFNVFSYYLLSNCTVGKIHASIMCFQVVKLLLSRAVLLTITQKKITFNFRCDCRTNNGFYVCNLIDISVFFQNYFNIIALHRPRPIINRYSSNKITRKRLRPNTNPNKFPLRVTRSDFQ